MKVAKEKVWSDGAGTLVADGDEKAAVLVAAAGQTVPDALAEQFKNPGKFFRDAVFDSDAKPVTPKDAGPAPQNREEAMPKLRTRAGK